MDDAPCSLFTHTNAIHIPHARRVRSPRRPPIDGSFTRVGVRRSVDSTRNETRERPIVPPFTSAKRPHRVRVHVARESSVRPSVLQVGGVRVHASEKTKRNRPYAIIDGARKERFARFIHPPRRAAYHPTRGETHAERWRGVRAGRPAGRSDGRLSTHVPCTPVYEPSSSSSWSSSSWSPLSVVAIGRRRRYPKNEAPNETNPCLDGGGRGRWWWSTTREGEVNKRRDSRLETRDSRLETRNSLRTAGGNPERDPERDPRDPRVESKPDPRVTNRGD